MSDQQPKPDDVTQHERDERMIGGADPGGEVSGDLSGTKTGMVQDGADPAENDDA